MTAITYRTAGAWGPGKGSNLTAVEYDNSIYNLDRRIYTIETDPPEAISVSSFEVVGSLFYVHMTDSSVKGPYQFPEIEWSFRTGWLPLTAFYLNDVFVYNGTAYSVRQDHTSAATFDPNAAETAGNLYRILFTIPEAALPDDGEDGDFLIRVGSTALDTRWGTAALFDLSDVDDTTAGAADGDSLLYDEAAQTWYPGFPNITLDNLTDVLIGGTAQGNGDVLKSRDGVWVNEPVDLSETTGNMGADQLPNVSTALGTSGAISLDPRLGTLFTVTPTNDITLNALIAPIGALVVLKVLTSGTSSYNITPNSGFKSAGVLASGTSSGKVFTVTFMGDGTYLNEIARTAAM